MNIKYYHLAKDEGLPEEFCAVKDVGGEPSEYVFYVPESENDRLRELMWELFHCSRQVGCDCCETIYRRNCGVLDRMRELGIEMDE